MDTKALRQKILDLAIRGKLVPQDPNDEPASVLLGRIRQQKQQMVKEGKLKPKDIKNDSVIFVGEDNLHYEKFADGRVKCIEDEIPFDLPEGWEWVRLGCLAQYKKGPFGSSITKAMFVPDTPDAVKIYEQKNAINKDATLGSYFISAEKYETLKGFEVFPNDIIVSCAGTIGETYVLPIGMRKGIINQALMKISLYDLGILDFYLMYFDFKLKSAAQEQGHGIALKNIPPFDVLKRYLIPIPPIQEQKRIISTVNNLLSKVNSIDEDNETIFTLIVKAKSKILDLAIRGQLVPQDLNDEPASVLLERIRVEKEELIKQGKIKRDKKESVIFRGEDNSYYLNNGTSAIDISAELPFDIPASWCWEKLKDIVMINPRNKLDDNTDVAFIPMPLIEDGYSGHHTSEIHKWKEVKTGFTHFQEGDVGVAKITPCFENRKSVIFENLNNGYGAGTTELYVFRPYGKTILPQYLLAYMKSAQFIENGKHSFAGAVGQQRVSKEYVENVYFPIPPIDEQKRIVHQLTIAFEYLNVISDALT